MAVANTKKHEGQYEFRFRRLFETAKDGILILNGTTGAITEANPFLTEMLGYTEQELLGKKLWDIGLFEDHDKSMAAYRELQALGYVRYENLPLETKSGQKREVEFVSNVYDVGGEKVIQCNIRDISERKQAEEVRLRLQLSAIVDSSEDAIVSKTLDGKIVSWNKGARNLYGYREDEVVDKDACFLIPPHCVDDVARSLELIKISNTVPPYETKRLRKDGSTIDVAVTISPIRNSDGKIVGASSIARNISEQKHLQYELHRKNEELEMQYRRVKEVSRLKSEFLANMSHELRTPLNSVIGFSELMYDGKAGAVSEMQKEFIGDILSSGRHLLQLINDVLDLSKVESGKMEFCPEEVHLKHLCDELIDTLKYLAEKKNITIDVAIDPALENIRADPSRLRQVLYNYLSNAIKFTSDGGNIILHAQAEGDDFFRLAVEDDGIGIKQEDIGRLFVEFQQLDGSSSKRYPGTGLGLALTKRLVEAQGGTVGVVSKEGKGCKFFAVLPHGR